MTSEECPVCFEVLASTLRVVTPCMHVMCLDCLWKIHPQLCPLCRVDLSALYPSSKLHAQAKKDDAALLRATNESVVATAEIVNRMNEIFPDIASAWETATNTADDDGRSVWRMMTTRYPTSGDTYIQIVHARESDLAESQS